MKVILQPSEQMNIIQCTNHLCKCQFAYSDDEIRKKDKLTLIQCPICKKWITLIGV